MAVGRLYEMVRKGRANPLWPPVGPDRRGDTQEVTKKPASPWRPQLVMHPHQRVRLRSLLMIGQNKLCAPRPSPSDAAAPKTIRQHANPAACTAPSP